MSVSSWDFPYPSKRMPVLADDLVAASQPLAAQAGLAMLARGGNAVDAAIATAIALTVVEPVNNGLGSDAFAIVHHDGALHGLNASGRSPAAMTPQRFAGESRMPMLGWDSVTVPGAVSAWVELSERFGRLPFADLFEPAIRCAEGGFLVSPVVASQWQAVSGLYSAFPEFARVFLPGGRAPRPGERMKLPDLAASLAAVASSRGEAFYRGYLGSAIAQAARADGGLLVEADLDAHRVERVETMSVRFAGVDVHEPPPNGQGIAALMALGILACTDVLDHPCDGVESMHLQIEAMKLAFADLRRFVADPAFMDVGGAALLDPAYLATRAGLLDPRAARQVGHGAPRGGDTVYLCAADREGTMVSFIQSNYFAFGSGVVVPGTGISLQNRGSGFSLEEGHPNRVGPSKRPLHTILPGFVTEGGRPRMAFGVMGGAMQPQGHLQMVLRIFGHGQNPQAAADAPRWQVLESGGVAVEEGVPESVRAGLEALGHEVSVGPSILFGGAQAIGVLDGGGYLGATETRKDGVVAGV